MKAMLAAVLLSLALTAPPAQADTVTPQLTRGWNLQGNTVNDAIDVGAYFGTKAAPVAGVTENVVSVWTWNATARRWAFYTPVLTPAELVEYTGRLGYDILTTINPGTAYWVMARDHAFSLPTQTGTPVTWDGFRLESLPSGFNLIATGSAVTPSEFNTQVTVVPPAPGANPVVTTNFTTLWAWNRDGENGTIGKWFFYAPSLEASGGLPAVKAYCDAHNYLHFQDYGKTLGHAIGFWIQKP